jgi:hypothetical protein
MLLDWLSCGSPCSVSFAGQCLSGALLVVETSFQERDLQDGFESLSTTFVFEYI